MVAINHATTGAIIGLSVANPLIALPAALISHFVLDIIPHYGNNKPGFIASKKFKAMLGIDALLCMLLVIFLGISQPQHWILAAVCAFVAALPDFLWIPKFLAARAQKTYNPTRFDAFAARIQWFQRPIGGFVEAVWLKTSVSILVSIVSF